MTNIFTNTPATLDFEEGDLTDYDSTTTTGTGTNTAVATAKYGSYGHEAKITTGASNDYARGNKTVTWPAGNIAYLHGYFNITAKGTRNTVNALYLCGFYQSTTTALNANLNPSSGLITFYIRHQTANVSTGLTFTASLDTWYEFEIKLDRSGSDVACEVWIDGVSLGTYTATGLGKPASAPDNASLPVYANYAAATNYATLNYDHVQAEDARIGGGAAAKIPAFMRHYRNRRT